MNIFRILLSGLLLISFFNNQEAQIKIDGNVLDSDSNPIENALVLITDQNDTTNYYSAITNGSGYFLISNITEVTSDKSIFPIDYIVLRNYPNPFNPSTIIYYELPKSEKIEIKIYDILGRQVRTLYNNFQKAGIYNIEWDGRNNWNSPVAAGVYFCRLKTKDNFKVNKMVLLDGSSIFPSTTNARLNKIQSQRLVKVNSVLNYSIKVSGENILETEFNYLSCTSDTTLNLIVPKILASVTIGPEGGKLETEDFSLSIPEGAFTEPYELKLGDDTYNSKNITNKLTKAYKLEGFPITFNETLLLKIKSIDDILDSVTILNVCEAYDPITSTVVNGNNFISARDSSGYIISEISMLSESYYSGLGKIFGESPKNEYWPFLRLARLIGIRAPVIRRSENFFFVISSYQNTYIPLIDSILGAAESAYSNFCDILNISKEEFINTFREKTNLKNIILSGPIKEEYGIEDIINKERPSSYCRLKLMLMKLSKDKEYDYIHEDIQFYEHANVSTSNKFLNDIYHYIYYIFPLISYGNVYQEPTQYWLHHSVAAWSEELKEQDDFSNPLNFNLHLMEPFNGIQSFLEVSSSFLEGHGIGMSALIKHFTNAYGNNIVGKFFSGLKSNSNALEVIIDTLTYSYNTSESIWWPNFFKEYIEGNIYNVPGEEFLKNVCETIEFNNGDTLKYVDDQFNTYNDISAKLFRVNINSEELKTNGTLNFNIGPKSLNLDYVKALVFGINNNNLHFLAEGIDFPVGNLNDYDGLLVCVVNSGNESPFTGTSNIDLEIRTTDDLPFNHCQIDLEVCLSEDCTIIWDFPFVWTDGTFKNNVFTGTIDPTNSAGNTSGTIEIHLDSNHNITSLFVNAVSFDGTSTFGFTASNIPPTKEYENIAINYEYQGNSTCNYVTSIYDEGGVIYSDEIYCGESSLLVVRINYY